MLDTWFSSQLWPFSVFGWPEKTPDLEDFYPTDVLVTGYDILFFWVARMIMAGLRFTGQAPFSHGPPPRPRARGRREDVEDQGQRDRSARGDRRVRRRRRALHARRPRPRRARPSRSSASRMAGSRNFATKLWNAARFTLAQLEGKPRRGGSRRAGRSSLPDRWILSRLRGDGRATSTGISRRSDSTRRRSAIYAFLWHELCDGYLEMVKPVLAGADAAAAETGRAACCAAASRARWRCSIPFMPFLTEEIWEKLTGRPGTLIVVARTRRATAPWRDAAAGGRGRGPARARHARAQLPDGARALRRPSRSTSRSIRPRRTGRSSRSSRTLAPLLSAPRAPLGRCASRRRRPGAVRATWSPGLSLGLVAAARRRRRRRTSGSRRRSRPRTRRSRALRRSSQNADFLGKAPAAGRREGARAALRARREAARAPRCGRDRVRRGRLDPDRWQVLENCVCLSRDPVLERPRPGADRDLLRGGPAAAHDGARRRDAAGRATAATDAPGRRRRAAAST